MKFTRISISGSGANGEALGFGVRPKPSTLHSRELTCKPKKGPTKTTVLLKMDYMGFHVSLGECYPKRIGS